MSTSIRQLDRSEWLRESSRFADHSYRQAWSYGLEAAGRVGARSEHIAVELDGETIGLADVRLKRLPLLGGGLAYVNGGPLVRRDEADSIERSAKRLSSSLLAIADHYSNRGWVVRIAPVIGSFEWNERQERVFADAGFDVTSRGNPYYTIMVDLDGEREQLRQNLARKWRNKLNASERGNLEVQQGTDVGLFDRFSAMFNEITERKGFRPKHDDAFYRTVQAEADECEQVLITIVSSPEGDAAGHVGSILGDTAVYLLGASNKLGRATKAAHLAQWSFMMQARNRGCAWYDLGGIDPEGNESVYRFKSGMGGVEVRSAGPFELVGSSIRGRLVRTAEALHERMHAMISRHGSAASNGG